MNPARPGPYHSKLRCHVDEILRWRRKGFTWKEVTAQLAALKPPVKTDPGSVCRFVKRYEKKPYAIGADPRLATIAAPAQPPGSPEPTPTTKLTPTQIHKQIEAAEKQKRPKIF
jgi:hypothetical protein